MKKSIFEKFLAKSLSNENQKSIMGGDFNQCLGACMSRECPDGQTPMYPCCRAECLGLPIPYTDPGQACSNPPNWCHI